MAKKQPTMGDYLPVGKYPEYMRWCIGNGIKISPMAKSPVAWWIDIVINGNVNRSPETYGKKVIWEKIFEFYKYYYEKHNNKQ